MAMNVLLINCLKMNSYALFFDIDGTLVSFATHSIPVSTVNALEQAKANGHRIYIATGRPMAIVDNLSPIEHLVDGYITTNGAYCFVGNDLVCLNPILRSEVDTIFNDALENDYPVIVSGVNDFGVWNQKPIVEELFVEGLGVDASTMLHTINSPVDWDVLELTPFIGLESECRLMGLMSECQSARWHPLFCDITSKRADKGQALLRMACHEGFSIEQTMAFGDGGNDISIIMRSGIGVAMGNANKELKEVADFITKDVDNDGIAHALTYYGLI